MHKKKFFLLILILSSLSITLSSRGSAETRIKITSIGSFPNRTAQSIHISSDGNYFLVGTEDTSNSYAALFKFPKSFTGEISDSLIIENEYDSQQISCDINNDGSSFLVCSWEEYKAYYQVNSSSVPKWVDEWTEIFYDVQISGNGQYAVYTGYLSFGMRVKLVYASNGSEIWHFDATNILNCDISFDGSKIIVGSWNGTLWCFERSTNQSLWKFTDPNLTSAYHKGISADGSTAFIADNLGKYIFLIDVDSGDLLWSGMIEPSFSDVEISHNGSEVLVISKYGHAAGIKILLFPRDSMTAQWEIHLAADEAYGELTADGTLAAVADANGNMMFIDCQTGVLINNHTIGNGLAYGAISPLGNTAAAVTSDGHIYTYAIDSDSAIDSDGGQNLLDPFLNSQNYPALGITAVVGIFIGLLIGRLRRNK